MRLAVSEPVTLRTGVESSDMPIYEYDCRDCRRVVSVLVLRPSTAGAPTCPRCGGSALARVMSRFATIKSEEARMESLADSASLGDIDENDPASVARFMKKMGREMGDDLGDDFDQAMDEALDESAGDEAGADSVTPSGGADEL
ncbi:MAG: FmdB family zinc ribbon protein [Candidatus Rokuibacteriota bacterium]